MSPPLISDYKKIFTIKRLSETFLGGPRLFCTQPICIALHVTLFTLPAIILSVINLALDDLGNNWKAVVVGLSILVTDLSLALGISILKRAKRVAVSPVFSRRGSSFLAEEDQIQYEGILARSTWMFIAPNVTVHEPLYVFGILCSSLGFGICTPLVVANDVGNGFLRGFGLFALCNARYSAVISRPSEIATFDPIRQKNLLYRPFYANILGLGNLLVVFSTGDLEDSFWFQLCLSLLPFLFGIGFLPPLDVLFPWLAELVLKLMGGSPTYFYIGNFLALLMTLMCPVIVFISRLEIVFIILIECLLGYAISCDIGLLIGRKSSSSHEANRSKRNRFNLIVFLKPFIYIGISLACVLVPMISSTDGYLEDLQFTLIITSFAILVVSFLLRKILIATVRKVWREIYMIQSVFNPILTFLTQFWIAVEISSEKEGALSLKRLFTQTLTIRAFALSITHPRFSALDMAITTLLKLRKLDASLEFIILLFIVSFLRDRLMAFSRHMTFIGIILSSTVQTPLLDNTYQILATFFFALPYSIVSLITASLVEGSTLGALFTLPIFIVGFPRPNSFWKESWFPKSIGVLQGTKKNLDWIIYSDVGKSFTSSFVRYCDRAQLKLEPGNCYVARYDDRLLFLRIVTSGWNFAYVQIKGLEMQEQTSCHHQEAAAMDEQFEKAFGNTKNILICKPGSRVPRILQPLMTFKVATYSESKASILSLKTKEERAVFRKMFFKTLSYLWIKSNPLFHGIDAYRKSICSGYNLHSTDDNSFGTTSPDNNSFDYGVTNEKVSDEVMFNNPHSIAIVNNQGNSQGGNANNSRKMFGNELPVWTLSHLPTLPGMEFNRSKSEPSTRKSNDGSPLNLRNLITNTWVSKCVEDLISAPGVKDKVEELCWETWNLVFGQNNDLIHMDLQRFFSEAFVAEIHQMLKLDGLSLTENCLLAFRYAVKLTLDEIYSGFEEISEEEIFAELNFFEEHSIRFCAPGDVGSFIQEREERIISMFKAEDGGTQLRIFNYEKKGVEFRIGQLSRSCVEGIWANLNTELLYLTSDDDERFSIQQDKYLMRNITTQCANAPLGYPVYEATFRVNLFNFNAAQI